MIEKQNMAQHEERVLDNALAEKRIEIIDKIIADLPGELRREESPVKSCDNCYNLGKTCAALGLYWASRRCKDCFDVERYGLWSSIFNLRKECVNDLLHPLAPDAFPFFERI